MDPKPGSPLLAKALPRGADADVAFAEPWEAKAFAIVVKLAEAGHFTWSEWVECFSKEVAAATAIEAANGRPKTYYEQWLDAAERMMIDKGVTSKEQLIARRFAIGAVGSTHVPR
jgi:nitrile hydratase accessory protein